MRRFDRFEGTAFTRRKSTHEVATEREDIIGMLRQMSDWGADPWAPHRCKAEAAYKALQLEISRKPDDYKFKRREDEGWYFETLVALGRRVQDQIDQGDAAMAAHHAALFGETWSELELKLAREREWTTGRKIRDGGNSARRGAQDKRVADVDALCSGPDRISKRKAFEVVARQQWVTASAIQTDYYKGKKRLSQTR